MRTATLLPGTVVRGASRAIAVHVDVRDFDAVQRMGDRTANAFGALRVVVNNAGRSAHATAGEVTLAEWNDIVTVNLTSAFCTTKAGPIGLTKSLAPELAPKITVNALSPGCTRTDMTRNALAESEQRIASRIAEPEDIAALAAFLASEEAGTSPEKRSMQTAGSTCSCRPRRRQDAPR